MRLVKYENRPENWDELIEDYESKTLFHTVNWHKHIAPIFRNSRMEYFYIEDKGDCIGYFCGLLVKRYSFKIMGSPLKGTGTNYMGPIVNKGIDQSKLIKAILAMCKQEKIIHIELCNDIFNEAIIKENGFKVYKSVTHKVPVEGNEDDMLQQMKSTGRNRVKKAINNGLIAKELEDDTIIPLYIKQLQHVYGRQHMDAPFGENRVRSLCTNLDAASEILKLGIFHGNDIIATGIFPYSKKEIYFWGAASWRESNDLNPNELLHWEVLKFAAKKEIGTYNMCGGHSQFKNKFGGEDVDHTTYTKSFLPFINFVRNSYKSMHWIKLKVKNALKILPN